MTVRKLSNPHRRDWLLSGAALAAGAMVGVWREARAENESSVRPAPPKAAPMRVLDDLGVEITALRLGADDFLIDLRYRVNDVTKAQPLLEQKLRPVLVNESTGDRFYVPQPPKVGQLRQSATSKQPAIAGRVYFMLFANPDRRLKSGERVTLYAGDTEVKDLLVG